MKLHIGAFNKGIEGWINTDITPHLWIAHVPLFPFLLHKLGKMTDERYAEHKVKVFNTLKYLDLTKSLPYPSESIEAIFSSHVLEHLFMDEVEKLILEFARVLKTGGVCRVVVPDLEKIIAKYDVNDPREFLTDIFEISKRGEVKNSHHCGFTGKFLISLFSNAGFSKCSVLQYQTGNCPDIDKLDNRPDSIFFEAIK
jgi:ubiquinone/menaquinone biosynthesis C-methylase UbiE